MTSTKTTAAAVHPALSDVVDQLLAGAKLPAAPLQLITLTPPHHDLPHHGICPPPPKVVEVPKMVTEYPMPGAMQTHEMAVVGENMLLVTQQTNSTLLKVQLCPLTGRPISCSRFLLDDFWAGLHGLAASHVHRGHVWASMQFKNKLVRINVGLTHATSPVVEQVIPLPPSVYGPHCVYECGTDLWTSCKDSCHVVRINQKDSTDFSIYPCSPRPIFMAMHPTSGDVYASLDLSNKIWRLVPSTGETSELDIDTTKGTIPVGLVAGPDGNVWFTLLGGASGGTGTFTRISATGEFEYLTLTTPIGVKAGLIHLAFDWDYHLKKQTAQEEYTISSTCYRLWLLASSLVTKDGTGVHDAVFSVLIDSELGRIVTQHSIVLPTQLCATHRILPHRTGLFVSQLKVSSLAHIAGAAALKPTDVVGEMTDMYNDFGLGQGFSHYVFSEPYASRGFLLGPSFPFATTTTLAHSPLSTGRGGKRPRITSDASA